VNDEHLAAEQAMVDEWLGAEPPTPGTQAPAAGPAPAPAEVGTNMALKNGAGEPDDHRWDPDREGAATMHATKTKKREQHDMDPDEVLDILLGTPTGSEPSPQSAGPTTAPAPVPPAPVVPVPPPPMPRVAPPPPASPVPPAVPAPATATPPGLFAVAAPAQEGPTTTGAPPGLFATAGASEHAAPPDTDGQPPAPHIATPPPAPADARLAAPPSADTAPARAPLFYSPPEAEAEGLPPDLPAQPSAASLFTEILSATPDSSPIQAEPEHDPGSVTQDMTIVAKRRKRFRLR